MLICNICIFFGKMSVKVFGTLFHQVVVLLWSFQEFLCILEHSTLIYICL